MNENVNYSNLDNNELNSSMKGKGGTVLLENNYINVNRENFQRGIQR